MHQKHTTTDRPSKVQTLAFLYWHTHGCQPKEQFHSTFTEYLHPRAQALYSSQFTELQQFRSSSNACCPSLLKLICSNESTNFTKRSGKGEASSLIRSATGTSFTQCSSKTTSFSTTKEELSLASKNQRKDLLSPQPSSPQKPSWESVSFPLKPPVLSVLRSIRPQSRSPSPPIH